MFTVGASCGGESKLFIGKPEEVSFGSVVELHVIFLYTLYFFLKLILQLDLIQSNVRHLNIISGRSPFYIFENESVDFRWLGARGIFDDRNIILEFEEIVLSLSIRIGLHTQEVDPSHISWLLEVSDKNSVLSLKFGHNQVVSV